VLELRHIVKRFGTTVAVDDVSLNIAPGEIVGMVGENGAGKTTLMRIAAHEIAPDAGTIDSGSIGFVHQHFTLVPEFTIAENLALVTSRGFFLAAIDRQAVRIIEESGIELKDVGRRARDLSVGEKAKLELIKALALRPDLLILDEPTSVLTPIESAELFAVIRKLGRSVVFISHKVREVLEIAQRVVVMRGGKIVAEGRSMRAEEIAEAMVAGDRSGRGSTGLSADDDSARRDAAPLRAGRPPALRYNNLELGPGEIVAIVGVAGNGQTELVEHLRATHRGRIGFIPEDRTRDALVAEMTVAENLALGARRWNPSDAIRHAENLISLYRIRARGPRQDAGELSGGNQQKVVLARELDRRPEILVAAEPTRGLDIEATRFVHDQLRDVVAAGTGVLLLTSDLDEAFALADGIHVIYRGTLSDRLPPDAPLDQIARRMAGLS
jgi:general nucleoside transport system ATP-binding protein